LPRAEIVSGRWSSATSRRMLGRLGDATSLAVDTETQRRQRAQRESRETG